MCRVKESKKRLFAQFLVHFLRVYLRIYRSKIGKSKSSKGGEKVHNAAAESIPPLPMSPMTSKQPLQS